MSKLNVQGLARRDPGLMSCIVADPGHTIVSVDLSAGEPTATAHYSQDKNYYDACFGMVGKEPYYAGDLLKIDDIYLTAASFSPMGRDKIREAVYSTYNGESFGQAWLNNPDLVKAEIKEVRSQHKPLTLGIGYSMGPKKLQITAYKNGFSISYREAKEFFQNYWKTFYKVRELADTLSSYVKTQGYIVNDFGYRLVPDADYKALNYYIQSSISGIINIICYKFFSIFPDAKFITVIHDEILFQVPDNLTDKANKSMLECVKSLNDELQWTTAIRVGWVEGQNWYEAK